MARRFTAASSDYLNAGSASPFTGATNRIALSAWVRPASVSALQVIFSQWVASPLSKQSFELGINSSGKIYVKLADSGSNGTWTGTTVLSAGTWYHVLASGNASGGGDGKLWLNGVQDFDITGWHAVQAITSADVLIGGEDPTGGTPVNFFDGDIADVAIWQLDVGGYTASMPAKFIAALASGAARPPEILPAQLRRYYPLFGQSPEPDFSGFQKSATLTGTAVSTSGPPVRIFTRQRAISHADVVKQTGGGANKGGGAKSHNRQGQGGGGRAFWQTTGGAQSYLILGDLS